MRLSVVVLVRLSVCLFAALAYAQINEGTILADVHPKAGVAFSWQSVVG
jgi:hypothetical protein